MLNDDMNYCEILWDVKGCYGMLKIAKGCCGMLLNAKER